MKPELDKLIVDFGVGILAICGFVMHYVGLVDVQITYLFNWVGIFNPQRQFLILFLSMTLMTVVALRVVRGMLGWVILIMLVLLMLHRILPGISAPGGMFSTPIDKAL